MFKDWRPSYQRLAAGSVALVCLLLLTYLSVFPFFKPIFAFAIASVIALGVWEFYHLCTVKGYEPLTGLGVVGSLAYVFSIFLSYEISYAHYAPPAILYILLTLGFLFFFSAGKRPLTNLAMTYFGIVYVTIPLSFALQVCFFHMEEGLGLWWFLYLVLIVKMTDIGGYVFGKRYGKRLLAPYISPNKTWEGAFGGLFLGTLASVLFITNLGHKMGIIPGGSGMLIALVLGLILSIAAQFGDLSESLLKREAGVKDSNQFPGLGGILDILDSLVFTSPILYVFLMISEGGAAG